MTLSIFRSDGVCGGFFGRDIKAVLVGRLQLLNRRVHFHAGGVYDAEAELRRLPAPQGTSVDGKGGESDLAVAEDGLHRLLSGSFLLGINLRLRLNVGLMPGIKRIADVKDCNYQCDGCVGQKPF
jgi:hypothetical protein